MGQTTPNLSIFIPSAGETNYEQSFASGMMNIDQHDHSGGPNKGVPITGSGLADFSVTYDKLNANVVNILTGIGTEGGAFQNRLQILGLLKNIYQIATATGFIAKNGALATARTITGTAGRISVSNGDGAAGDPVINLDASVPSNITGTANQIAVTPSGSVYNIALAPVVINATQPAFSAVAAVQANVTGNGTDYKVLFSTTTFQQGTAFSTVTSVFTAPITGIYNMGVSLYIKDTVTSNGVEIDFYINGVLGYTAYYSTGGSAFELQIATQQLMKLNLNDTVEIHFIVTQAAPSLAASVLGGNFTGVLVC